MAEENEVVVEEQVVSEEDQVILDQDLTELGHVPDKKEEVIVENLTPEEEEDRREDALHQDKTPEEREAIRERRRVERQEKKQRAKEKEESYRREIEGLRKQLQEVNTWKNTVEQRNIQSGVAQIDKGIQDANDALELAKQAIVQATQEQNGQALVEAQELYYAARKRSEDLTKVKQTIVQKMSQQPKQPLDQLVAQNAQNWIKGKPWYDPSGKDPDSKIALAVDNMMAEEGWDPRQPEYWVEIDERLKKYLPHRFAVSYTNSNGPAKGASKPPTESSTQTSTRPSSGYVLSSDRVRAIKDAGAWDDPKLRREMIQSYIEYDKQQQRGR